MRLAPLCLAVALAAAAAGCTAIDMDRLEGRYESLVRAGAEPAPPLNSATNVAPALLDAGAGDSFLDLARRSRELAGKADDAATRIALLRLAALSGWQAGTPEGVDLASVSADEARRACADIDPQRRFRPARDCAIAEIVPMLLAADGVIAEVAAPAPREPASADDGRRRLELIREVRVDFVDRLAGWDQTIAPAVAGNDTLQQWYRGSRRLYACVINTRLAPPLRTVDDDLNRQLLEAADSLSTAIRGALGGNPLSAECAGVQASAGGIVGPEMAMPA